MTVHAVVRRLGRHVHLKARPLPTHASQQQRQTTVTHPAALLLAKPLAQIAGKYAYKQPPGLPAEARLLPAALLLAKPPAQIAMKYAYKQRQAPLAALRLPLVVSLLHKPPAQIAMKYAYKQPPGLPAALHLPPVIPTTST